MARETKADMMRGVADVVSSKLVGPNTVEYTTSDGGRHIRLHRTTIMSWYGPVLRLDSGGWKTVTTKTRMNQELHKLRISLFSKLGVWYLRSYDSETHNVPFFDGIKIKNGVLPVPVIAKANHERLMGNTIKKFAARLYDTKLYPTVPKPHGGDCWGCLMMDKEERREEGVVKFHPPPTKRDREKEPRQSNGHLKSHLDEGYTPGSLIVNAMRWCGYKDSSINIYYGMTERDVRTRDTREIFVRAIRRYLRHRFGLST